MLVCSVSLRARRSLAAAIAEAGAALDNVNALRGLLVSEAASATATVNASIPVTYAAAVLEAISAAAVQDATAGAPFTPAALTGLIGWWDASITASMTLSGTDILAIADQSSGGNALSWTGFGKPVYAATGFNSKPAMTFNGIGIGNAFTNTAFPLGTGNTLTCWYAGNCTSANAQSDCGIISYTGAGQTQDYNNLNSFVLYRPGVSTTQVGFTRQSDMKVACTANANHRVIVTINSSGLMTFYIDGIAMTPTATASGNWTSPGILNIGRAKASASYWAGPVGEFGIATGYSNATTVGQLDTYLKTKWGL